MKEVKAYAVTERSEAMVEIVFATSGIAARRLGANAHDTEFEMIDSCRRAPWADQYGSPGKIPAQAWIDNGFSQTCNNCEARIFGDETEDDDGNVLSPVYVGTLAYCCSDCKEAREAEMAARNASGEAFKKRIQEERPYLQFTQIRAGWPWMVNSAGYTFEGAQYGGGVSEKEDGSLEWHVNGLDKESWDKLMGKINGPA